MSRSLWGVEWRSINKLDGYTKRFMWHPCTCTRGRVGPVLFWTRREARAWISDNYGYIAKRKDLRGEPHGWRMPVAVRARVSIEVE